MLIFKILTISVLSLSTSLCESILLGWYLPAAQASTACVSPHPPQAPLWGGLTAFSLTPSVERKLAETTQTSWNVPKLKDYSVNILSASGEVLYLDSCESLQPSQERLWRPQVMLLGVDPVIHTTWCFLSAPLEFPGKFWEPHKTEYPKIPWRPQ